MIISTPRKPKCVFQLYDGKPMWQCLILQVSSLHKVLESLLINNSASGLIIAGFDQRCIGLSKNTVLFDINLICKFI